MRWSKKRIAATAAAGLLALLPALHSADEKRLSVFTPKADYAVAITEHEGRAYVPLADLLEPLAHPEFKSDGGRVRVRVVDVDAELRDGKSKAKIGRGELDLGAKVIVEDGRVLVPLHTVPLLLSRLLGLSSDLHEGAHRIFIGAAGVRFSAQIRKGETSALVLSFTAPVNPSVSTEPGRLRLVFVRDPVVSGSESFKFDDATIPSASYSEGQGVAELDVAGKAPLMASFSDGGRTITIAPAPGGTTPPAAAANQQPAAPATAGPAAPEAPLPTGKVQAPLVVGSPRARYLVVIDPGHGGDDHGAKLGADLEEKDVTLAFARRLRAALTDRGIPAHLLRDGDPTISNEQRAAAANNLHATVFVTIHAGVPGTGVRLYTSLLPEADMKPATFYPWDSAQSFFLRPSRIVAQAAVAELGKRKLGVILMPANVQPMNNVAAAAIAVELTAPAGEPGRVSAAKYQDPIAAAIAAGVANARAALEAPQ
jgi:N-acetylmuramoyl-L-alanine amidase